MAAGKNTVISSIHGNPLPARCRAPVDRRISASQARIRITANDRPNSSSRAARVGRTKSPSRHCPRSTVPTVTAVATATVISAIHWQAVRLWWKKVPIVHHPGTGTFQAANVAHFAASWSPGKACEDCQCGAKHVVKTVKEV